MRIDGSYYYCKACKRFYRVPQPVQVRNRRSAFYRKLLCLGCAVKENRRRIKAAE